MADVKVAALVASVKSAPGLHYKNPRLPVHVNLPSKLEYGTKIYIHGCVAAKANRFSINLKNAETNANNYLHFSPLFDKKCVVRNSRLNGAWGAEEREGGMPFTQGQPFLVTIIPTEKNYQVEVNGLLFITFNHRVGMPLSDVTHLGVCGDLNIYGIHVRLNYLPIPMSLRIPKNLFYGDMLVFDAIVPKSAKRFHVDFQSGPVEDAKVEGGLKEDVDVIYQFNTLFPKNQIICNNRCSKSWGKEQVIDGLPIHPGDPFEVCIVAAREGFIPIVNGNPLPTFPHRRGVSYASYVVFSGDISLQSVTIDCAPVCLPAEAPDIDINSFDDKAVQALRPTIPVVMALLAGFGPGKCVYLSGKVPVSPSRFAINLQCGEGDSDIAFQFNPRWDTPRVLAMRYRIGDKWENELQIANPIVPGSEVDIFILCQNDDYVCLVDGDVVAHFKHRMDCNKVTHVRVDGSINVYRILGL